MLDPTKQTRDCVLQCTITIKTRSVVAPLSSRLETGGLARCRT